MFSFANVNQDENLWIFTGLAYGWEQRSACMPYGTHLLSPAPLTTCGVALGASRPLCASMSPPVSPQTAAVTGTAWKGSAAAPGASGGAQPVTFWTAALPTAACTASAPTVSHCGAQRRPLTQGWLWVALEEAGTWVVCTWGILLTCPQGSTVGPERVVVCSPGWSTGSSPTLV